MPPSGLEFYCVAHLVTSHKRPQLRHRCRILVAFLIDALWRIGRSRKPSTASAMAYNWLDMSSPPKAVATPRCTAASGQARLGNPNVFDLYCAADPPASAQRPLSARPRLSNSLC